MRFLLGVLALAASSWAGLAILVLLAAPAHAQQHLTADTAATTADGASFTAPADWRLTERAALRLLEPPEGDSHLAVGKSVV